MRRLIAAGILACLLSVAALAGDIPTSDSPAPPPPCVGCAAISEPSPGDIPSDGIAEVASEGLLDLVGALSSLAF